MPVVGFSTQYATATDLANLGLAGGVLSSISLTAQNAALLAASGLADASLQARYTLPLIQWGQDLVRAVVCIAAYDLLTSKGYNPSAGADLNIRERYVDALAWLKSVADEEETPGYIADSTPAGDTSPDDDSETTNTIGAFQLTTTAVRGWTRRGGNDDVSVGSIGGSSDGGDD